MFLMCRAEERRILEPAAQLNTPDTFRLIRRPYALRTTASGV
jgi:hypothetical protein